MDKLTAAQKKKIKQISHDMKPLIYLGKNGLTQAVVKALITELENHEVVKIRFQKFKEEKKELGEELAAITNSIVIRSVGNVITLYRESKNPEKHIL